MGDAVSESRPVEWMRELYENATAESMIRWTLAAWVVVVVALVVLDRMSAALLGRSRPLTQPPPRQARTWRWRRNAVPPVGYSLLPAGTMLTPAQPRSFESIPLRFDLVDEAEEEIDPVALLDRPGVPDREFWQDLADEIHPLFGYENNDRLRVGRPPERFNPVLGWVEHIDRDAESGSISWPSAKDDRLTITFDHDADIDRQSR